MRKMVMMLVIVFGLTSAALAAEWKKEKLSQGSPYVARYSLGVCRILVPRERDGVMVIASEGPNSEGVTQEQVAYVIEGCIIDPVTYQNDSFHGSAKCIHADTGLFFRVCGRAIKNKSLPDDVKKRLKGYRGSK